MSINLSNEEAMALSQLTYANIHSYKEFKRDYKGITLQQMAEKLCDEEG